MNECKANVSDDTYPFYIGGKLLNLKWLKMVFLTIPHISCPVCDMPAATIASVSPKEFAENLPTSTLISTVLSRKCAS
jgi:hypothetical protein